MNIDDITAKVRKFSMETVAEVQKMNEVRGLSSQVHAQKKMIQAMYTEMGKKLYDKYKDAPLEGFESDFHSLDKAFENIEELQEQIRLTKGVTLCPNCKMEVGLDERFCSNCGCKMPEVFRIVEDEPEETLEDTVSDSEAETPADDASAAEVPAEEAPADDASAAEVPAEEAPADDASAAEVPAEEAPADDASAAEVPAEEAPADDASTTEVPAEEAPADDVSAEDSDAAIPKSETDPEQPEV